MTSKAKHQHPLALIFSLYQWGKQFVVPIAVVVAVSVRSLKITVLCVLGLLLVAVIGSLLDYFMFQYRLEAEEIVVKQGIFVKKVNHVPYDRIQNIVSNQWFFLKPFHVEAIEIETAAHSDGPEVSLTAVSTDFKEELDRLRSSQLKTEDAKVTEVKPDVTTVVNDPKVSYRITRNDLVKFALTSPAFLSGLLAILAIYGKLGNEIQEKVFSVLFQSVAGLGIFVIISLILAVLLIFYIGSAFLLIVKYYHFTLVRTANKFDLSAGLFKTKKTTITMDRIQAIIVKQPLLRRLLKIATVKLVVISNSEKGDTEKDVIVMPVLVTTNLTNFMTQFFPTVPIQKCRPFQPKRRTYYYDLRNAGLIFLPILLALVAIFYRWPILWSSLALLIGLLWLTPAYLQARRSNVAVLNDQYVYLQNNRFFTKNTYFVPKNKIQSLEREQSVWLQKKAFAHLNLYCRSGNAVRIFRVKYLATPQIEAVIAWYKEK